ncbi:MULTISPECIES: hypothetical protein [Streptomyces]|uniref:Anti-sigma factor n=1 Tax=Streptomyces flavovirens TaxID=52258 RepID=A0ABV8NF23_9ACTN|nr:hypothetical protein [Streptomyces sp. MBT51]MBK3595722.1 hypothetical protein [Streptomyces sp. MBT51]
MDEDLRKRLHLAAASHRPDRARMLARIERGMAGDPPARTARPPRRPAPWLRVAGAAVAVCGVLAAGAFAVTQTGSGQREGGQRMAAPPAPVSDGPAGGGALPAESGPLRSDGVVDPHSNRYWAQNNVTVTAARPLTGLTVEIRVALNGGVDSTGFWRSLPEEDFTASAREEGGFLVYRWTLKQGRRVPPGTHTFAGQYNHAEGTRDAGRDDYTARADASGEQSLVGGDFAPKG